MEQQLRRPPCVFPSIAMVAALVHALVISCINYNCNPGQFLYLYFYLPSTYSSQGWVSFVRHIFFSVGDCTNVPNLLLFPACTYFVSVFAVPLTQGEGNISHPLIFGLDHVCDFFQPIECRENDDVLVSSQSLRPLYPRENWKGWR